LTPTEFLIKAAAFVFCDSGLKMYLKNKYNKEKLKVENTKKVSLIANVFYHNQIYFT